MDGPDITPLAWPLGGVGQNSAGTYYRDGTG